MSTNKTELIFSADAEALFKELGLTDLREEEKKEVLVVLLDHFNKVILESTILNLYAEDVEKFRSALKSNKLEEEITSLSASVPGLAGKIEEAVENEFQVIKAAKEAAG